MPEEPPKFSRAAENLIASFRRIPDETPARMRRRPTCNLAQLVETILVKEQIGRDSPEHTIRENWPQLVGPANAHYSHAAQLDPRGCLAVIASHAVVRQELFHHRQMIVDKIKQLPGCSHVRLLNIRAG